MKTYNKLVRDNIPSIIKENGGSCKFHVAKDIEFKEKLFEKLIEETNEFTKTPTIEEFADVMEVMEHIAILFGFSLVDIKETKKNKKIERGGFRKKIILDSAK